MKDETKDKLLSALAFVVILIAIVMMCLPLGGCSTPQKIEKVEVVKEVHDTTTVVVHDTTRTTDIVHDSVDRIVRDSSWMDSLGNHYHERYVSLTKYINTQHEEYAQLYSLFEHAIEHMNDSTNVQAETIVKEKKVYVWWPLWIALGIVIAVVVFEVVMGRLAKNLDEREDYENQKLT